MLQCAVASARGSGVDASQLRTSLGGVMTSMMAAEVCTEDTNALKGRIWVLSTGFVCLVSAAGSFLAQESVRKVIFKCLCSFQTFVSSVLLFICAYFTT